MTEDEKKAIEYMNRYIKEDKEQIEILNRINDDDREYEEEAKFITERTKKFEVLINLIEKQQKALENSVPKEVLRNVIKELKNEISKNDKMIVEYRSTIEENRLEKEAKIDKARFDNVIYYNQIRILKEILGE